MDSKLEAILSYEEAYKLMFLYYRNEEGRHVMPNLNSPLNRFDWSKVSLERRYTPYFESSENLIFKILDEKKFSWYAIKYGINFSTKCLGN